MTDPPERPDPGSPGRPERWLAHRGGVVELFRFPAAVFGALASLRDSFYRRGWLPSVRIEVPVVSVGNLSAGGTGKTPCVFHLVRELRARGLRPGVLSRGYRAGGAVTERRSDEARMLLACDPELLHVENPDRVSGGYTLIEAGAEVVVLDDGFQHRRLARDLDLVLVDATRPWGLPAPPEGGAAVRAMLPRGLLREKPAALERADAILVTRTDQVAPVELAALEEELENLAPGRPVLLTCHRPRTLRTADGRERDPASLLGQEVDLVSGIGNPDSFEASVIALGARIHRHVRFPDHHAYAAGDLDGLGERGRLVVTTAKDAVKIDAIDGDGARREIAVLEVELSIERGAQVLEALLDALPAGRRRRERAALHEGLHG